MPIIRVSTARAPGCALGPQNQQSQPYQYAETGIYNRISEQNICRTASAGVLHHHMRVRWNSCNDLANAIADQRHKLVQHGPYCLNYLISCFQRTDFLVLCPQVIRGTQPPASVGQCCTRTCNHAHCISCLTAAVNPTSSGGPTGQLRSRARHRCGLRPNSMRALRITTPMQLCAEAGRV